jgi:hypothetical protein
LSAHDGLSLLLFLDRFRGQFKVGVGQA